MEQTARPARYQHANVRRPVFPRHGPSGRPSAAGIGAAWIDGDLYFTSGPGTRKSGNLAANPGCTIPVRLPTVDLVIEGKAIIATDAAMLQQAAKRYRDSG